jgi:cation diffusion facilitator family transporter
MTPQRRTALVSVVAACVLVALKLGTGLATGSLGLISEALHSGTDLVAALLTFFAVGVAVRPADEHHPYGHGKAEHLSALAEAAILALLSVVVAVAALRRLGGEHEVDATWWAIGVVLVVIAIDIVRMTISLRVAREHQSAALEASAYHFGSDLAGSTAVLAGLVFTRYGYAEGDAVAALFVSALVLLAAARLIRNNVDVLMDRRPVEAEEAALRAIGLLRPRIELRRLRMREAGGRHFADVVIGVEPDAAVGQGHAAADAVEAAVQGAVPRADVVVHVEPSAVEGGLRDRVNAAVAGVPGVREVHNVTIVHVGHRPELSLHVKLPGELTLEAAHDVAEQVEHAIAAAVPEVGGVQVHLEPLKEVGSGTALPDMQRETAAVASVVREMTGVPPKDLRLLRTDDGLVVFLTLTLDREMPLWMAHKRASEVEARIRRTTQGVADVVVHTEP